MPSHPPASNDAHIFSPLPVALAFVLLRNLIPYLRELKSNLFLASCAMVVLTNVALCIAFKFYFLVN